MSGEGLFWLVGGRLLSATSPGRRGEGALWGPFTGAHIHSRGPPRARPAQTIALGLGFAHVNLGGTSISATVGLQGLGVGELTKEVSVASAEDQGRGQGRVSPERGEGPGMETGNAWRSR